MVSLDTEVELLLFLDAELDEEKACEHSGHQVDKAHHKGNAEWYLRALCPSCESDTTYAACDTIKKTLLSETAVVRCRECGNYFFGPDYVTNLGRIKDGSK